MLTIANLAEALSISTRTAQRLIKSRQIKAFQVGRVWRIDRADLDAYIASQKAKVNEPQLIEITR